MIRHWLGEVVHKKKQQLQPPTPRSSGQHCLTQIPRKDGKLVRKRCVICYAKNKAEATPLKTKQINMECLKCGKAYCLQCFNDTHSNPGRANN